jgi:hypothetical protein
MMKFGMRGWVGGMLWKMLSNSKYPELGISNPAASTSQVDGTTGVYHSAFYKIKSFSFFFFFFLGAWGV